MHQQNLIQSTSAIKCISFQDDERTELIENLRMTLADAAFQDNSHDAALHYLSGVFTADSAYKEAQVSP